MPIAGITQSSLIIRHRPEREHAEEGVQSASLETV